MLVGFSLINHQFWGMPICENPICANCITLQLQMCIPLWTPSIPCEFVPSPSLETHPQNSLAGDIPPRAKQCTGFMLNPGLESLLSIASLQV